MACFVQIPFLEKIRCILNLFSVNCYQKLSARPDEYCTTASRKVDTDNISRLTSEDQGDYLIGLRSWVFFINRGERFDLFRFF